MKNKKKNKKSSKASRNLPFARMLFIDKEIAKGDYPSAPFIAKKYGGVSLITIKRDIDYMRNNICPRKPKLCNRKYLYKL